MRKFTLQDGVTIILFWGHEISYKSPHTGLCIEVRNTVPAWQVEGPEFDS